MTFQAPTFPIIAGPHKGERHPVMGSGGRLTLVLPRTMGPITSPLRVDTVTPLSVSSASVDYELRRFGLGHVVRYAWVPVDAEIDPNDPEIIRCLFG